MKFEIFAEQISRFPFLWASFSLYFFQWSFWTFTLVKRYYRIFFSLNTKNL